MSIINQFLHHRQSKMRPTQFLMSSNLQPKVNFLYTDTIQQEKKDQVTLLSKLITNRFHKRKMVAVRPLSTDI